jgi:hypothetical protein
MKRSPKDPPAPDPDPLGDLIGFFEGPGNLSDDHDEILYSNRPEKR